MVGRRRRPDDPYYYGQTGIACAWYYRRYLFKSAKNFFLVGLLPLLGGLMLAFIFVWGVKDYAQSSYEDASWFGIGPVETYPDRRRGGPVGRWESTVTDQLVPYIRPQENGGRADVRWIELRDTAGGGLRLTMDRPRQVSATHFRAEDLATATHEEELRPRAETVVHIDAAHRGVGTASCGPDTLPEYLVGPGTYRWSWTLSPVSAAARRRS